MRLRPASPTLPSQSATAAIHERSLIAPDTTRTPRAGEIPGTHYHYVTRDEFGRLVSQDAFVEHATFGTNNYGTSVAAMRHIADQGRICILDIEMEGAKQIAAHPAYGRHAASHRGPTDGATEGTARFMFLAPPSLEVLEKRLRGRGTEDEESLRRRLEQARREMEWARTGGVVEKVVVNDALDVAYRQVRGWIFEEDGERVEKDRNGG